MRFGMMAAVGMLAATAGMAHGERENRGLSPIIHYSGRERAIGVCLAVEMTRKDWQGMVTFDPASEAATYMELYAKQPLTTFLPFDSVRVTHQPAHGTLVREIDGGGHDVYVYRPNAGYLGQDSIEAVVPVGDDTVRIVYKFIVQPDSTEREDFDNQKFCPNTYWKISSSFTTPALDNLALQSLLQINGDRLS